MSHTFRNVPENRYFRRMRTHNEIAQNVQLLTDIHTEDIPYFVSKLNRIHRYIPDSWDDCVISSIR
jgi:hypothetical protein